MFGFGKSEKKAVEKLRAQFEDIRQRVLLKMNEYEQYSFVTAFDNLPDGIAECFEEARPTTKEGWKELSDELLSIAREGYRLFESAPGLHGEGGRAGIEALAFLAFKAGASASSEPQALLLSSDMEKFRSEIAARVRARFSD
ncbi:hypothetical protein MCELHM10_02064 [Paracoccaceae bacterium]|jgi:hypothetical protein